MTYQKVRRSGRISKQIPIVLIGSDWEGKVFSEETVTVVLSLHGAGLISRYKLIAEQELTLRSLVTNREADVRVVGEIGSEEDAHTYGVAFLDESLDFWKENFPPPLNYAEPPLQIALACSSCRAPFTIENGDFEADVCAIHGGLVRYCDQCGLATMWKPSHELPAFLPAPKSPGRQLQVARDPAPVAVLEPYSSEPLALESYFRDPAPDRRQRVRAKVNYFACVRSAAFGDDIVTCIDMSRGGLSFRTKHPYLVTAQVSIAVPFSPESSAASAIFVSARIVNVAEIPERQLFRCGAAFLPRR